MPCNAVVGFEGEHRKVNKAFLGSWSTVRCRQHKKCNRIWSASCNLKKSVGKLLITELAARESLRANGRSEHLSGQSANSFNSVTCFT